MDLLDRYVQAVRFFLPARQQDDIVRELTENLVSQMEDREQELGRALTEAEQAEILRRHGHPMLVAGRYRQHQQLIGPAFFPIYLFALKIGIGVCAIVTIVLGVVAAMVAQDPGRELVRAMLAFPGRALMVFAWTTLGFAAVDFAQARLKLGHGWDPRELPKVGGDDRIPRVNSVCEVLFSTAVLAWLLLVPGSPQLLFGPVHRILGPAPVWNVVYVPLLVLTAAGIVIGVVNVMRPYWTSVRSLARIATQVGGLVVIAILLRAGAWVVARPGATLPDGGSLDRVVDTLNKGFEIGLLVAAVIALFEIGREVYRLWSRRKGLRADPAQVSAGG